MPTTNSASLAELTGEIVDCRACPRLVSWRELVADEKRAAFRDQEYWGRPVPGFGDPDARILLAGLAPAAHGGNRTGRVFTGDRSGDFLFASMYRSGLSNQPESTHLGDGLRLAGSYVAAAVRCAPPANKPTTDERDECAPYFVREIELLVHLRVIVALGAFAYEAVWRALRDLGATVPSRRPRFTHGLEVACAPYTIVGAFHPSQQNTFTGRLTPDMLDAVLTRAGDLAS